MALRIAHILAVPILILSLIGCDSRDSKQIKSQATLDDLQQHHGSDGWIQFEYISEADEAGFTGVVVPNYSVMDGRTDDQVLQQCRLEHGTFARCIQKVGLDQDDLKTIYGYKIDGLELRRIGRAAFVKLRQPALSFSGYQPVVDRVSVLTQEERTGFEGRVEYNDGYESYTYDFIAGKSVRVTIQFLRPRT